MPTSPTKHSGFQRFLATTVFILALPLGAAALLAGSLASAVVIDSPALLIAVGAIASFLVMLLASTLALRLWGFVGRTPAALAFSAVATLGLLAVLHSLVLRPLIPVEEQFVRVVPDDVELWSLSTGSVVAVRKVAARGERRPHPVVFLHGGPGAYGVSLEPTVNVISRLGSDGYDVYFYDQIGGGLSERLQDISEYTHKRHLDDLNAVYERIGADQIVLIGSSAGASLGANYMADHPDHIAAAVFSGSSPIYHPAWAATGDGGLDERLTPEQSTAFSEIVETPRLFAALILAEINPRAAVLFAGEAELGSLFDKVANEFYLPIAACDSQAVYASSYGYGFWSNRMTSKTLSTRAYDPRPALRQNNTPVLVLRGECDYKKEGVASEYADVFPNAQLEVMRDVGHMPYWEQPDTYLLRVRQFLAEADTPD